MPKVVVCAQPVHALYRTRANVAEALRLVGHVDKILATLHTIRTRLTHVLATVSDDFYTARSSELTDVVEYYSPQSTGITITTVSYI